MEATGWTWAELQATPARIVQKARQRLTVKAAVQKANAKKRQGD